MEKNGFQRAFYVVLVTIVVTACYGVPLRVERQTQDLVHLDDGIALPEYDDSDYSVDDLPDANSEVSPIVEPEPRNVHSDKHDYHGNGTDITDQANMAHEHSSGRLVHDLDIIHSDGTANENDQAYQVVDHAINGDRNLDESSRTAHADTGDNEQLNLQGQGHLSSSKQSVVHPTSESQSQAEHRTTRSMNSSGDQHLVFRSVNTNGGSINVSTHEEHEIHQGFLMGDNIQQVENAKSHLNTNHLPSSSTLLRRTTTSLEQILTVKRLNISNQERTPSSAHEHMLDSRVIITQDNREHSDSEAVDNENHVNGITTSTEISQSHDGHVAMLPGEPHASNHDHEARLSGHEEPEGHHPGIDVPIDKGEHPHNNHEGEHIDQGSPRHENNPVHTNNSVRQTPNHGIFPEVEPTVTTPKLVILPTPAQVEERNTSAENLEPHSSVEHNQGVQNEHTESHPESGSQIGEQGDGNIRGNSGHVNNSEERQITAAEGHIEYITEVPERHGENERKQDIDATKETDWKSNNTTSISPSSAVIGSESSGDIFTSSKVRPLTSAVRSTKRMSSSTSASATSPSSTERTYTSVQTLLPNTFRTTELISHTELQEITETTKTPCLDTESGTSICSTPISKGMSLTDHSVFNPNLSVTPTLSSSGLTASQTGSLLSFSATSTTVRDTALSTTELLGILATTTVPVQPSAAVDLSTRAIRDPNIRSSYRFDIHLRSPVTERIMSYTSSTLSKGQRFSSGPIDSHPTIYSQSTQSTEENNRPSYTPTPVTTRTIQTPASMSVSSSPAAKKKAKQNTTTTVTTISTTRKKDESGKEPEKQEGQSTTRGTRTVGTTTLRMLISVAPFTSTQTLVLTTPPSVYIEIQLRMDWNQFCISRSQFISEIKEIMMAEKGYVVEEEQFKMNINDCGSANNLLNRQPVKSITIQMYIVDNDGKLDILLTTVTSSVISKGFHKSNYLKNKILSVQTVGGNQPDRFPDSRIERKEEPPAVTMVIGLASVGGVCCVALVILQVVLIHRRIKTKRKQPFVGQRASLQSMDHVALGVIPKSRPNSGYWNPALDSSIELPEPEEHSHLLNFSGLANFCMDTKGIFEEFQTIPYDDVEATSVPVGEEDKNRFANVLPHKQSRVTLSKTQENKTGYINANYIDGYMGAKKVYIATQSPLVNTVNDFWRMVWEQQSRSILMLNPVTQYGKPKQSTCYWPDNLETDCRREFGDYIVTLKKRDVQKDYVDCTLEIMDIERNLKREIHHFWFTCWSDTGPPEPLALVKFVLDTRPHFENSRAPVLVHCGPGTGRTGVFIAVDICMRMFEDRRRVDIKNCVFTMRSNRAGAVQTKEQFNLIYQALNEYAVILSSPSISTRSSVITLHAML